MKVFIVSRHRASDGALGKLRLKLEENNMLTKDYEKADIILACADREETYMFVMERFKENKRIIHLWAGEQACWSTFDDVYRSSMTLMSEMQLCTNETAKKRVEMLCLAVNKKPNAYVVGNVYLDGMYIDEENIPDKEYDLVLYNPPSRLKKEDVLKELKEVLKLIEGKNYRWIEPNMDKHSDLIMQYVTTSNLPRPQFLGLLKNCKRFITNSSCQYSEAPFLIKKEQIISVGVRNKERESKYADMSIRNASENIIKKLKELK